jgi:hypothetical protein
MRKRKVKLHRREGIKITGPASLWAMRGVTLVIDVPLGTRIAKESPFESSQPPSARVPPPRRESDD